MRILLLNQFYPPDVAPTGQFLSDLAVAMAARGHEVHVVCSRRAYDGGEDYPAEERLDGVRVHRLFGPGLGRRRPAARLLDYASFWAGVAARALWGLPRPDLVVSLTTPPYLGLLAAALARWRGVRHAHWVMDLYPDALAAHDMLGAEGRVYRGLQAMSRLQYRRAACVLALGPFMARTLGTYATEPRWVPLWGDGPPGAVDAVRECRGTRGWQDESLVLMYSGNMGLGHRFTEFLEAAARLGPTGPLWAFAGGGVRRPEVEGFAQAHAEARLALLPYVPRSQLSASLAAADVHLVSLSRAWQGVIVPSKIQGIFSAGRPALFVGPPDNEAARWIGESGGGWVVGEGDVEGVLAAVDAARDPGERRRRGDAALRFAREHFDRTRNVERIAALLEESVRPQGVPRPSEPMGPTMGSA